MDHILDPLHSPTKDIESASIYTPEDATNVTIIESVFCQTQMEDRISALPDSLICHILSFLPTEQAHATSVLSKRWRPLWLALTTLNFDDRSYVRDKDTYFQFIQLVYTVLLLRDGQQTIKKFGLNCESSLCNTYAVKTWVIAAIQREVEYLSLSLPKIITLSLNVFSSTSLVILKLSGFTMQNKNSSVSFPSLKILHLRMIHFLDHGHLVQFLSACPVLEVLFISSLLFSNSTGGADVSDLHLPKLVKAKTFGSNIVFPLELFSCADFLSAEVVKRRDLSAHNFSNLTFMELGLSGYYLWDWVIELLHHCPYLLNLVIHKNYVESNEIWGHPQFVPECLISKLKSLRVFNYGGKECELQFTRFIMQNANILQKLTVCSGSSANPRQKLQMLKDLSFYSRASPMCEFSFE